MGPGDECYYRDGSQCRGPLDLPLPSCPSVCPSFPTGVGLGLYHSRHCVTNSPTPCSSSIFFTLKPLNS